MKNRNLLFGIFFLGSVLTGRFLSSCQHSVELPQEVLAVQDKLPETVDYNLHVKPILSDRCFKCHGPDKAKIEAGLQLASFEGATLPLKSGAVAIDPGNIGHSELIKRILSHDPEEVMPTPKSNLTLSDEEKAILIKWIEQGATYKEHWSITPIQKPDVPKIGTSFLARWGLTARRPGDDEQTRWVRNDIDRFTLDKMNQLGLKPSPEADKTTLLRRVYMDLTGLPPTLADVEKFRNDTRPDGYERVVDQLLNSSHFGEQQAISWLDVARFADSQGYQDDPMRNAYPYRDWVIRQFNQNRPFDQFITEQLAGDLLPSPVSVAARRDRLVATSFNRQHAQSGENGIVPEEYRIEYVADRTNTFGKAMLGLTMECCRCHDHKYDPISHKDYYSLFAFFNQNKETGQITHNGEACPTVMLPSPDVDRQLRFIQTNIKTLEPKLSPETYQTGFVNWSARPQANSTQATGWLNRGLLVHLPLDEEVKDTYANKAQPAYEAFVSGDKERKPQLVPGKFGNGFLLQGDCGIGVALAGVDRIAGKLQPPATRFGKGLNFERNQPFSVSIWTSIQQEGVEGAIFRRSNYENEGYRGYSVHLNPDRTIRVLLSYVWPANCIELRTRQKLPLRSWQHLTLTYNGNGKASGVRLFVNGKRADCELITDNLTKGLLHGPFGTNKSAQLPIFEIGNEQREKTLHHVAVDELRIYNRQISGLEVQSLATATNVVATLLAIPTPQRSALQQRQLLEHYTLTTDSAFATQNQQVSALRGQEAALLHDIPEVMTMQELPASQSRKSFILNRGVFDAPGEEVTPQVPHKLGQLPPNYPRNRLGLARWLLDETNPLFARVMVNRFWQQYFGNGLVRTQEDFGNQGELPSHPELLDWLAVQFRNEQWNVKSFIRRMVLSATYRQSSRAADAVATKEQIEKDPDNKWLARGSSYRYTAEQVRDNALAASGLLVRKIGGPSVYPYQPAGIWEALATRNTVTYRQQHGDSLYRRSMYTIWKRTSPPPMMLNFDAPDRALCTVRRQKTATPLQALVTLNDPQFVEAARVLAERTMKRTSSVNERITYFFQAALSRSPRPSERALIQQLYHTEYNGFLNDRKRADRLLQTGEFPRDQSLNPIDVAAYTVVATTLLNYDEALVKR